MEQTGWKWYVSILDASVPILDATIPTIASGSDLDSVGVKCVFTSYWDTWTKKYSIQAFLLSVFFFIFIL